MQGGLLGGGRTNLGGWGRAPPGLYLRCCPCLPAVENPYRVDVTVIHSRAKLLQKYVTDEQKELQALYALQALVVKLDQPPSEWPCSLGAGVVGGGQLGSCTWGRKGLFLPKGGQASGFGRVSLVGLYPASTGPLHSSSPLLHPGSVGVGPLMQFRPPVAGV